MLRNRYTTGAPKRMTIEGERTGKPPDRPRAMITYRGEARDLSFLTDGVLRSDSSQIARQDYLPLEFAVGPFTKVHDARIAVHGRFDVSGCPRLSGEAVVKGSVLSRRIDANQCMRHAIAEVHFKHPESGPPELQFRERPVLFGFNGPLS